MKKSTILHYVFFIILFLLNVAVTFFAFNQIPENLAYDEILLGKLALSLDKHPFTFFTSYADGHGTPYFYVILLFFKILGVSNLALRLPAALSGLISVFVVYAIARLIWKNTKIGIFPLPLVVAIIFTCLRWRITFIRFSFEMPFLLLIELISTYFIFRFQESKKTSNLIISGLFAGLAFYSYQPGRIFFIVPLLFLILKKEKLKNITAYLLPFIVMVIPISIYLFQHPMNDIRVNQLSFIQDSRISISKKVSYIGDNVIRTGLMFIYRGDANGRHNYPYKAALNPLIAVLSLVGAITASFTLRKSASLYFSIFLAIALIPVLLTLPSENPHMLRTYTTIPSLAFFIGLAISNFRRFLKNDILAYVLLFIIALGCLYDLRTYFMFQSRVMRNSFEVVCPLEKVIYRNTSHLGDLPKSCRVQKNMF